MRKLTLYTFLLWGFVAFVITSIVLYIPVWLGIESQESKNAPIEYADRFFMPVLCDSLENYLTGSTIHAKGPRWYRHTFITEFDRIKDEAYSTAFNELDSLSKEYPEYIESIETTGNTIVLKTQVTKIDGKQYTNYPVVALSIIFQRMEEKNGTAHNTITPITHQ